mmetsp:Transcript_41341/g.162919  ORF Transcript_41341/g.162919 Transcript_41341/m.162919 type:complete len:104 (-) Transcript_41341:661-972(-)
MAYVEWNGIQRSDLAPRDGFHLEPVVSAGEIAIFFFFFAWPGEQEKFCLLYYTKGNVSVRGELLLREASQVLQEVVELIFVDLVLETGDNRLCFLRLWRRRSS